MARAAGSSEQPNGAQVIRGALRTWPLLLVRLGRRVGIAPALTTVGPFLPLLGLWVWATHVEVWPPIFLPPPSKVLASLWDLLRKGIYPLHVGDSLSRLVAGALISLVLGVAVGVVLGVNRLAGRFFYPLLSFFQSVAEIGWLPLAVIWFGFGFRTILFVIGYTIFFPMVFSTLVGVRTVPPNLVRSALTLGARRHHVIFEILLPGAFPSIVTGIRVGMGYGWRALIAAEMLVGETGLGFMIFDARKFHLTERIILGMLTIGLLWLLTDRLILKPLEAETIERWGLTAKAR